MYSVRIQKNATVEAAMNLGPLGGVVKATSQVGTK